jgi:hypothetical protein
MFALSPIATVAESRQRTLWVGSPKRRRATTLWLCRNSGNGGTPVAERAVPEASPLQLS